MSKRIRRLIEVHRIIYALVDPVTNLMRYIGLSTKGQKRCREHISEAKNNRGSNPHLLFWLQKLINNGLEPEILIIEENFLTDIELSEAECFWIEYYKYVGCPLMNMKSGGFNGRHSPETIKKMSVAAIGRMLSDSTKAKLSLLNSGENNPWYGRFFTEEHRNNLSRANTGKKASPEAKSRMSLAKKGKSLKIETKKKMSAARTGLRLSEESKKKISISSKGKVFSEEQKLMISNSMREKWKDRSYREMMLENRTIKRQARMKEEENKKTEEKKNDPCNGCGSDLVFLTEEKDAKPKCGKCGKHK